MPMLWPEELPQKFDKDGYQDAFADNRHATQTDLGPALIRSRISSMPRKVTGVMKMSKSQLDRLRQFWKVDTLDGKLPFVFPDPVFGTGGYKNWIPNSGYAGAVPGLPGTLPTGWSGVGTQNGIYKRVDEIGVENGLQYVDIGFSGSATGSGAAEIVFASSIVAAVGQTWTESAYVRMKIGNKNNLLRTALVIYELPSAQGSITNFVSQLSTAELQYQRYQHTRKLSSSGTTSVTPRLQVQGVAGQFVEITLRVAGVQMERANRASDFIFTPNTGTPTARFAAGGSPPQPTFLGGKTWGVNIELEIFEV